MISMDCWSKKNHRCVVAPWRTSAEPNILKRRISLAISFISSKRKSQMSDSDWKRKKVNEVPTKPISFLFGNNVYRFFFFFCRFLLGPWLCIYALFRRTKISVIVLKSWCFTGGQRMARSKASKHDTFFFKHRQKGLIALAYLVKSVSDSDSTSNSHSSYLVDMFPIKIHENPDMFRWYDELLAQWTATKEARRQKPSSLTVIQSCTSLYQHAGLWHGLGVECTCNQIPIVWTQMSPWDYITIKKV